MNDMVIAYVSMGCSHYSPQAPHTSTCHQWRETKHILLVWTRVFIWEEKSKQGVLPHVYQEAGRSGMDARNGIST